MKVADLLRRPLRYYIDPELRVIHCSSVCPAASVAAKYHYLKEYTVYGRDELAALDTMEIDGRRIRACDVCVKREQHKASKGKYSPPPGFGGTTLG